MKTKLSLIFSAVALLVCWAHVHAADSKEYQSSAGVIADAAGVRNPDDGTKTGTDNSVPAIMERFVMGPAFSPDFEEGAFAWKGKRFNVGTSRAARARFERYLSAPLEEYEAERTYREILGQITDLLQVNNTEKGVDKTYQAWTLLYDAAKFPSDAEGSLLVANQIFNAWSVRAEYSTSFIEKAELERNRRHQERGVAYWDYQKKNEQDDAYKYSLKREIIKREQNRRQQQTDQGGQQSSKSSEKSSEKSSGNKSNSTFSAGIGDAHVDFGGEGNSAGASPALAPTTPIQAITDYNSITAAELARTNAEILALETEQYAANMRSKLQFQTQILSFLMQRRFQHALIAIEFYQNIFKGSHQGLDVGKTQLSQFFQTADITPSMRSLEAIAREAQVDVRTGMRSVEASYEAGDKWSALERLQETFILGEHHADVNAFSTEKRRELLKIYRAARDLQKVAETRDYASADAILDTLQEAAPDFPGAPVRSAVKTAMQASNIALYSAKQAMLTGDAKRAQVEMQQAVQLWPLNPNIRDFSKLAADSADESTQLAPMFDQLLAQKNYRQIYARSVEYGMALSRDERRAEQLKAIAGRLSKIDVAIAYAQEAMAQRNPYAAWETLLNARSLEENDPDLSRTIGQIAPQVGPFARMLSMGEDALANGNYASALAYFLAGQDMYPASQVCRIGVEKAGTAIMRQQAGLTVGAQTKRLFAPPADNLNAAL